MRHQDEEAKYLKVLDDAHMTSSKTKAGLVNREWLDSPWPDFFNPEIEMVLPSTGCDEQKLRHIGGLLSQSPPNFKLLAGRRLNCHLMGPKSHHVNCAFVAVCYRAATCTCTSRCIWYVL